MANVKVGVSRICITPPLGTPLSGYFEPRYTSGVLDDLYVTTLAFDDGENRAVLLTLDLCGLKNQWWVDECKKMISQKCGIPTEAVIITCSHSHTSPVVGYDDTSGVDSNKAYDDFLMQTLRDSAFYALEDVCDARFFAAESECKDVAFSRIFRMKNGLVRTNPGVSNPEIDHPITKVNENVYILKIQRETAENIILVNFGLHADNIGGDKISSDFPGFIRKTLERVYPDTVCLFLQGCEGDINDVDVRWKVKPKGYSHSGNIGTKIAGAVLQACDKFEELKADRVVFANKTVNVPTNRENHRVEKARDILNLHRMGRDDEIQNDGTGITTIVAEALRIINLENGPDEYRFTLSAIGIGDFVIVGMPGEPFAEIGMNIIEKSSFKKTFVGVLTDGGEIYFPTTSVMKAGGYEARSSVVKPGADDILVDGMVDLLDEVRK